MQYFGRALGSVSTAWSSLNPATLSGAIDIIAVEHEDGELFCSPFHVRFGKFQLLRPSQKKVIFKVNGHPTDIPMKLSDGGEAFFVFETHADVPTELQTSPVISAASSPSSSPQSSPRSSPRSSVSGSSVKEELEPLDIGEPQEKCEKDQDQLTGEMRKVDLSASPSSAVSMERAKSISSLFTKKNIPSTVEANGDVLLDMHGYKSNAQDLQDSDAVVRKLLKDEFGSDVDYNTLINTDLDGNIRILNEETASAGLLGSSNDERAASAPALIDPTPEKQDVPESHGGKAATGTGKGTATGTGTEAGGEEGENGEDEEGEGVIHFKTLRLTSDQLKALSLNYGRNEIEYVVNGGKATVSANLYLWKWNVPIVISDIDGTITKSDALGHLFNMVGKDWTHEGVAGLFSDIHSNGYNIIYLTARSVGLADMTRQYLEGVQQDNYVLPYGPVILSPDRTMEALKREIVLKKPQVFKMACLQDIEALYFPEDDTEGLSDDSAKAQQGDDFSDLNTNTGANTTASVASTLAAAAAGDDSSMPQPAPSSSGETTSPRPPKSVASHTSQISTDTSRTPFYAGFGNRITDALSYRSVGIPSSKIFTINPVGEVHMELLEMAGYKASYVSIGELVDQFFPPVNLTKARKGLDIVGENNTTSQFSDVNFWRSPIVNLSDLSDDSENDEAAARERSGSAGMPGVQKLLSPKLQTAGSASLRPDSLNLESPSGSGKVLAGAGGLSPRLKSFFSRRHPDEGAYEDPDPEQEEDDLDDDPNYIYEDEEEEEEEGDEEDDEADDDVIDEDEVSSGYDYEEDEGADETFEEDNLSPVRRGGNLLGVDLVGSPATPVLTAVDLERTITGLPEEPSPSRRKQQQ